MKPNLLKEFLFFLCGMRRLYRVHGSSMHPLLRDGDIVLIKTKKRKLSLTPGDIVICEHPYKRKKIIKQISYIEQSNGRIYLKGLNELESEDSSLFGALKSKHVLGLVTVIV